MTQQATTSGWQDTPFYNRANTAWGKPWKMGERHSPLVMVDMYNNNPRIKFRLNHPDEINTKFEKVPVYAKLDVNNIRAFFSLVKSKVLNTKEESAVSVNNYTIDRSTGTTTRVLYSTLTMGRDDKSMVYIEIKAKDRPDTRIVWDESYFHTFTNKDGSAVPKGQISTHLARAWMDTAMNIVDQDIYHGYVDGTEIKRRIEGFKNKDKLEKSNKSTFGDATEFNG